MPSPLHGKRLLLGVTGSIAAYKAAFLASRLTQEGAQVITLLTPAAARFVSPLTFQGLTGNPAYTQADLWGSQGHLLHLDLARQAHAMLIVPCTAETLAQLAQGHAAHLVGLTALALEPTKPLFVAPAMDGYMFHQPPVQEHLARLRERGVHILGPLKGRLASGLVAYGRMMEPEAILDYVRWWFARQTGLLRGWKVVVTAGPTWEKVDAVRVFTNRSSGKQGYALAEAARDRGADVVLISGPTLLPPPAHVQVVRVESAQEMLDALLAHIDAADLLLKAAAVADYRPARPRKEKVKKGRERWRLTLQANPDLLQTVAARRERTGFPRWMVGFAAESHPDLDAVRAKMARKGLDLILVNDITQADAGFQVDTNRGWVLDRFGHGQDFPALPKRVVAELLLAWTLYLDQEAALWYVAPWEVWQHARGAGSLASPFVESQKTWPLARRDQLPALARRLYPEVPLERLVAVRIHGPEWAGRWAWQWHEGDWWPFLRATQPLPLARLQARPLAEVVEA